MLSKINLRLIEGPGIFVINFPTASLSLHPTTVDKEDKGVR